MTTLTDELTDQVTIAGLRQQAERLGIPSFATMRKKELIKAINEAQLKENPPADPKEVNPCQATYQA